MSQNTDQKTVAILQARMSSSRLPGKVLMPLAGKPMMIRQIERLQRCQNLDEIIVATSDQPDDEQIAQVCETENIRCFRGNLHDVLDRYYQAALFAEKPHHIVRLTADCPLADPQVIDDCVDLHLQKGADYTSNTIKRHFPKGLDVEVMTIQALEAIWREAKTSYDREHVTPFLYQNPERFSIASLIDEHDRGNWRWTVDTDDDIEMVKAIYSALYNDNGLFETSDVIDFLNKNPNIACINGALG